MSKIPQEAIEALIVRLFEEMDISPVDHITTINRDDLQTLADAARAQGAEVEPIAWASQVNLKRTSMGKTGMMFGTRNNSTPFPLYTAPPAPQPTDREKVLEEVIREAIDLLMCRKLGSPARSPELNAMLKLQAALAGKAPSQTDRAEGAE